MNTDFPKSNSNYLKATIFQDQEMPLTYKGWEKKGNEDITAKGGNAGISWKARLKYQLRYSYPEFAIDEIGEKMLDKDGNQRKNRNYDPDYPQGHSILYHFDEGVLESGSLPLFQAFCMVRPAPGELITIKRTGEGKETKWFVKKITQKDVHPKDDLPEIQLNEATEEGEPF